MNNIQYQYMRPLKAKNLKKLHDTPFTKRTDLQVWQGDNATVLPLRKYGWFGNGGVIDANGNGVEISVIPTIKLGYDFTNPDYKDEKVVFCGYLVNHWGHFLVEAVARLWYFLENDRSVDKYVFVIDENEIREIKNNYKEFFELLKIWDKIEIINTPTTYRTVIVPELAFKRGYYSAKYLDIFQTVANNVQPDPSWVPKKKIFWSRSQWNSTSSKRKNQLEFGVEALDNFFSNNGYEVLFPEQISLSKLIFYIRNAEAVASVSGTLPHNMLFGYEGQKIVIIERCAINNDWQTYVNHMMDLRVTYIDANIPLYTVGMAGPFILAYNRYLENFANDNGLLPPDAKFYSDKFLKKCFVQYMKAYQKQYGYQWFMQDYLIPAVDYHLEAYLDGLEYYSAFLSRRKPFLWNHYFEIHYWKQFAKRFIIFIKRKLNR